MSARPDARREAGGAEDPVAGVEVGRPPVLLAYIYRRPGTPAAATELLWDCIQEFADRQSYVLDGVFVGVEGQGDRFTNRDLVEHVAACGARVVIVAGPAYGVLQVLRRLPGLRVLTLGDVQALNRGLGIRG